MIAWASSDGREENGGVQLPAASTIKLFVASAFWRSGLDPDEPAPVEPTPFSLSDRLTATLTLGDLALLALAVSDNAATNVLIDRLGFDVVNGEIERLGLERTVLRRKMIADGPENLTCARDLAHGLAALAGEERIVGAMALAQDSLLPDLLPGSAVAVKSGELDGVYHEAALVDGLGVAVCSSPAASRAEIARIAQGISLKRGG